MNLYNVPAFEPAFYPELLSELSLHYRNETTKLKVEPRDCHKVLKKNVFIHYAAELSENNYELTAGIDHKNQDFFFDHEIDHIPGMALAYFIRQSVLVISHRFLNIPYEFKFIMDDIVTKYSDRAELDTPLKVLCSIENSKTFKGYLSKGELKAKIFQDDRLVAEGTINFRVMHPLVYKRLHAFAQTANRS